MGKPEIARWDEYNNTGCSWATRGDLSVAFWMNPPKFNGTWIENDEGKSSEWEIKY